MNKLGGFMLCKSNWIAWLQTEIQDLAACQLQHADVSHLVHVYTVWFCLTCRTFTGDEQVLNKLHQVQERNQQVGCTGLSTGVIYLFKLFNSLQLSYVILKLNCKVWNCPRLVLRQWAVPK